VVTQWGAGARPVQIVPGNDHQLKKHRGALRIRGPIQESQDIGTLLLNTRLIVGADGTIELALRVALLNGGADVWATSRRSYALSLANAISLDLSDTDDFRLPINPNSALLCPLNLIFLNERATLKPLVG